MDVQVGSLFIDHVNMPQAVCTVYTVHKNPMDKTPEKIQQLYILDRTKYKIQSITKLHKAQVQAQTRADLFSILHSLFLGTFLFVLVFGIWYVLCEMWIEY